VKNVIGIFIGITLNIYIVFGYSYLLSQVTWCIQLIIQQIFVDHPLCDKYCVRLFIPIVAHWFSSPTNIEQNCLKEGLFQWKWEFLYLLLIYILGPIFFKYISCWKEMQSQHMVSNYWNDLKSSREYHFWEYGSKSATRVCLKPHWFQSQLLVCVLSSFKQSNTQNYKQWTFSGDMSWCLLLYFKCFVLEIDYY
jgi:hypothetical protein